MSKHTPGPWEIGEQRGESVAIADPKNRRPNGYLACVPAWVPPEERKATARLIAAAPDLLSALQVIRDHLVDHPAYADLTEAEEHDIGGDTAELSYLVRIANAAIAKAGDA